MATPRFPALLDALRAATRGLPGVTEKAMFGCDALFADGKIFGLIWKEGRIGLKLTDDALRAKLASLDGAETWSPGAMGIKRWVLVPRGMHTDPAALERWARHAHAQARVAEASKKPGSAAKKRPAKAAKARARR